MELVSGPRDKNNPPSVLNCILVMTTGLSGVRVITKSDDQAAGVRFLYH